jgi:hypothetical protein
MEMPGQSKVRGPFSRVFSEGKCAFLAGKTTLALRTRIDG